MALMSAILLSLCFLLLYQNSDCNSRESVFLCKIFYYRSVDVDGNIELIIKDSNKSVDASVLTSLSEEDPPAAY